MTCAITRARCALLAEPAQTLSYSCASVICQARSHLSTSRLTVHPVTASRRIYAFIPTCPRLHAISDSVRPGLAGSLIVAPVCARTGKWRSHAPAASREFRGVWVATVQNIDWPSKPGLPAGQQKRELIAILDKAVELNLNAVIFQIRPRPMRCIRRSWSRGRSISPGEMGKPPEPFYDPLEFAVEEAHRRGLQLHVWFNPYRVRLPGARGEAVARSRERDAPRTSFASTASTCGSIRASRRRSITSSPCSTTS